MKLQSDKAQVDKSQKTVFDFLSVPENYERLMPESTVKFAVNASGGFNFQLKGMPEIALKMVDKHPNGEILLGSADEKLQFELKVAISELAAERSEVQFLFDGQFGAMIGMMVKKPLKKFIDTLSGNLSTLD